MDGSIVRMSSTQGFSLSLIINPILTLSGRWQKSLPQTILSERTRGRERGPSTVIIVAAATPSTTRKNLKRLKPESEKQPIPLRTETATETKTITKTKTALVSSALAALTLLFTNLPFSAHLHAIPPPLPSEPRNASEVVVVERTLSEAWNVVRDSFFDRTYNNQDWDAVLHKAVKEISGLNSKDEAYMKIEGMLATLGDPYTRIVNSKEYESFDINEDEAVEGIGLRLLYDQNSCDCLVVLSPIEGGPAARAGIVRGDEVIQINGKGISDMKGEEVFNSLQGQVGTPVALKIRHQKSGINSDTELVEVTLVQEKVFLSPVSAAIIPRILQDGHTSKTGYIHISSFSRNAAHDLESTILQMEQSGVDSYILDIRDNPGGLVEAGLDSAQLWLNGYKTVVNIIDHEGKILPLTVRNTSAVTNDPLVVLVDKGTASASEILAAALHDNGRAILVGEKTYGKGKIQRVTELQDGSGLFITIAKYLSPSFHPIDEVGITPDALCTPQDPTELASKVEGAISLTNMNQEDVDALTHDSCVLLAERELGM